jgi:hypothetical protein
MMKRTVLLLLFLGTAFSCSGQRYIVTYLQGKVYHEGKLVKLHDRLDGAAELSSVDKTAELALFSAEKGKFRLSSRSELYQLVLADYLQGFNAQKTLTTRGRFSLEYFFNHASRKHPKNRVLLAEGERLPLSGAIEQIYICRAVGGDTSCTPVTIISDTLIFDRRLIKRLGDYQFTCLVKYGCFNGSKYTESYFSQPVELTLLPAAWLKKLMRPFTGALATYYGGDRGKLAADVEEQLAYYYGDFDESGMRKVLLNFLN